MFDPFPMFAVKNSIHEPRINTWLAIFVARGRIWWCTNPAIYGADWTLRILYAEWPKDKLLSESWGMVCCLVGLCKTYSVPTTSRVV